MLKSSLREKYKNLRKQLNQEEIDLKSLKIANNLLRLPLCNKDNFHLFLSIERHKEVNTEFILQILNGKDKKVYVSKSDFSTGLMKHILLDQQVFIKENSFGIPEPVNGIEANALVMQVVFVPLLAYDILGNRVGYGKGFYDTFLAECSSDVIKIGLSFFEAEEKIEDVFKTDISLDYVVTPEKIYTFN